VAEPVPEEEAHQPSGPVAEALPVEPEGGQLDDDELYDGPEDLDDLEYDDDGQPLEYIDEQGRRHVRRAAPEGTEAILEKEYARETGLPDRLERWRQKSAAGAVVTAFALGLQNALETERKEPAIIMQTSGDPPKDLPVEAQIEQLGPRRSTVTVRRWLLPGADAEQADETEDAAAEVNGQGSPAGLADPGAADNGGAIAGEGSAGEPSAGEPSAEKGTAEDQ
jgi:hypothetical protein